MRAMPRDLGASSSRDLDLAALGDRGYPVP
jgi:hypothetical protein